MNADKLHQVLPSGPQIPSARSLLGDRALGTLSVILPKPLRSHHRQFGVIATSFVFWMLQDIKTWLLIYQLFIP